MSLEAVKSISEAEEVSRKMKSDAAAAAKKALADAERAGREAVENASRRAAEETERLIKQSEKKAVGTAEEMAGAAEKKNTEIKQSAAQRLDKAASFIVGRIVNG